MLNIINPDSHEAIIERRFLQFLLDYREWDETDQNYHSTYVEQAEFMVKNQRTTLYLNMSHILQSQLYSDIAYTLQTEFYKYEQHFGRAVQEFMFKVSSEVQDGRIYFLSIFNLAGVDTIRSLRASKIGQLSSFSGTVTRSSEVRPELIAGTFICQMCNKKIENVVQQFKYTQPKKCTNQKCDNRTKWELDMHNSIFTDFQKIRVQEDSREIPAGSMPRSIDVILRNEQCEQAKPGDKCIFVGTLSVIPDIYSLSKPGERNILAKGNHGDLSRGQANDGVTGLKQLGVRDLQYKLVFIANHVQSTTSRFDFTSDEQEAREDESYLDDEQEKKQIEKQFQQTEIQDILRIQNTPDLLKNLAASIAPFVSGHEEVKKGILLMLVGGVNKKTREGVNIRGDINVCIVGDPSTAKSQFLKYTCSLMPRSVYTSGKASSAAGLTASVHKDMDTGEFCIEAGALMLADNGICCIDEFDKMDSKDQVAIHEAMEQQTISIAKAGIHATLNARASILAAANPIFGRYDRSKTLKFNVNMTQPIMSRFDLFFVITDQSLEFVDQQIAQHIVQLHANKEKASEAPFSTQSLKNYIRYVRQKKPIFTKEAAEYLKQAYVRLRQNDKTSDKASYRITVRQLESLIRLSEALAKIYDDKEIKIPFVREAEKLLSQSLVQVEKPDIEIEEDEEMAHIKVGQDNMLYEELKQRQLEEEKRRNKISITHDEFFQIGQVVLGYVKQRMQMMEDEIVEEPGVKQQDIVDWYLERKYELSEIQSEEELRSYERLLHSIIGNLIWKQKALIVVKDNPDYSQRQLELNSNIEI